MKRDLLRRARHHLLGRRKMLVAPVLALTVLGGGVEAASPTTPIVSGLGWRSGASTCGNNPAFASWRGRALDVSHVFAPNKTWSNTVDFMKSSWVTKPAREAPLLSVAVPLLTRQSRGQHAACAAGRFDTYFRQIGSALNSLNKPVVVRLGHEYNIGTSYPYGITSRGQVPTYINCFKRAASALKQTAPKVMIEWTNAVRGKLPVSNMQAYPGDSAVDIIGVDYYDISPQILSTGDWNKAYNLTYNGGPWGLGQWLKAAAAHGKKLAVSEWGVWDYRNQRGPKAADNPMFIRMMSSFFKANAGRIAYETYYNCNSKHRLYPNSPYPNSANTYRQLW